jgi:hypothetical protein
VKSFYGYLSNSLTILPVDAFKKNGALNISEWNGKFVKTEFDPNQTSI